MCRYYCTAHTTCDCANRTKWSTRSTCSHSNYSSHAASILPGTTCEVNEVVFIRTKLLQTFQICFTLAFRKSFQVRARRCARLFNQLYSKTSFREQLSIYVIICEFMEAIYLIKPIIMDNGLCLNCRSISLFSLILPGTASEDNEVVFAEVK